MKYIYHFLQICLSGLAGKSFVNLIQLFAIALIFLSSCKKDILQDGSITDGAIKESEVWANDAYARGVLNSAYFHIPEGYDIDGNGGMLASATDDAVNSGVNATISTFYNGTWSPLRTVDDEYNNLYEGLRKVNLFLQNLPQSEIIPTNGLTVEEDKSRLEGQAYFLRALLHFELVKRYGAVTLATRVFSPKEDLNLPKNTYKECIDQILADCELAIATNIPVFTKDDANTNKFAWRSGDWGRATKTAAMALKARMLLYAASPQFVDQSGITWQQAADAAKAIIDKNVHSLFSNYSQIFNYGAQPYNSEVIFATRAQNRNDIEQNNAPIGYDGARGRTNPTQELVDAFETKNGRLVTDPANTQYSESDPYKDNRDSRFKIIINYNGNPFKGRGVQTYVGGRDGISSSLNATKTGYYMRKFLSEAASWNEASNTLARRPWVVFRYSEVLLNYAEALNEAQGTAAVTEVLKYVNQVRARGGIAALQTTNPAGDGYVALTQKAIRERIHNERRVELCFEGHRFYDLRRWKLAEEVLNKPVTGMRITFDENLNLVYTRVTVENRVFHPKNYLYPFSQNTINRQPALIQNTDY